MSSNNKNFIDISIGKAGLIGGFSLLIMTVGAIFAVYFVFPDLIVPDDARTTVENIRSNELLFRVGICSYLIVIICDVLVAWALYIFLKPVNRSLSLLTAWMRLVYSTIFGIALVNYFSVLQLLSGADFLTVFEKDQIFAQAMLFLNAFNDGWAIGFIFFGFHLTLLGFLIFKSDYMPKLLGVLLILAGAAYLLDYFSKFLFPDHALRIADFVGWGELILMFWLLLKGRKISGKDVAGRE